MKIGIFAPLDHYPERDGPAPGPIYRRTLAEAALAEELGLESFWVTEHHFSAYGVDPDPAVLLAAVAAGTRRLRLGTATAVLPLRHPLQVAESYALLDQLASGRLEFGVGSGYLTAEFSGFGVKAEERRARFDEALTIIRQAWRGEPVRFRGRFYLLDAPPLNVRPVSPEGPPVHVAIVRPEAASYVGRMGLHLALIPYVRLRCEQELATAIGAFRAALPPTQRGLATVAVHCFCGRTPWHGPGDPAYAEAEAALQRYLQTRVAPGGRYDGQSISPDFILFGNQQQLRCRLRRWGELGVDRVLLLASFGGMPAPAVADSLRRAAQALP